MSAAWTMIFVTYLRSIWTSIPFSFLYNRDLTSVISFCCTRSFAVQDHVYFLFLSSLERIASKVILSMFLCIMQSLELGEYLYIGIKICRFCLRSETAWRQVTRIVLLKMSAITCSVVAYWIYSLRLILNPAVNTLVAGGIVRVYPHPAMKWSRNPERICVKLLDLVPETAASPRGSSASEIISLAQSLISSASALWIWGSPCSAVGWLVLFEWLN